MSDLIPDITLADLGYGDLTRERLSEVFDLVKDPANWKNPISTTVFKTQATEEEIVKAVTFFTGGVPDVLDEGESYWVQARGYYAEVGA